MCHISMWFSPTFIEVENSTWRYLFTVDCNHHIVVTSGVFIFVTGNSVLNDLSIALFQGGGWLLSGSEYDRLMAGCILSFVKGH